VLPLESEPPWPLEALVPDDEPSTGALPAELEVLPLAPSEPEVLPLAAAELPLLIELPWPLEAPVPAEPPLVPLALVPLPDMPADEVDDGLEVLLEVPLVPELCVVDALGDFLSLFMSPSASADPLASATIDVRMNAGASLRIWASKVELVERNKNLHKPYLQAPCHTLGGSCEGSTARALKLLRRSPERMPTDEGSASVARLRSRSYRQRGL
jgi:hypothetical protein